MQDTKFCILLFARKILYGEQKLLCTRATISECEEELYILLDLDVSLGWIYIMSTDNILWRGSNNFLNSEIVKET